MFMLIESRQNERYMLYFSHAYKASFRNNYTMCCPVSLSVPPVMEQPSYEVIMFLRLSPACLWPLRHTQWYIGGENAPQEHTS